MTPLYHLALPNEWEQAQQDGMVTTSTRDRSLAEEGFIHCSFVEQLPSVAARFYGDLTEVVVLRIDPARLTSQVVVEDLYDAGEAFPHVYGPIDLDAVVEARVVSPRAL